MLYSTPLAEKVIGCAIEIHQTLGPGLLESAYEECLVHDLNLNKIQFVRNLAVPLRYKGVELNCSYRVDILVGRELLLELKAVERLIPIHTFQVITYLKLLDVRQGLLMNFNSRRLQDGIKSILNSPAIPPT